MEERNLLPSRNRSTTDVLTILENNIAEAIKKDNQLQWCLLIFQWLTICAGDTISLKKSKIEKSWKFATLY
jgi:hypothetical protein